MRKVVKELPSQIGLAMAVAALWCAVVATALAVVYVTHRARLGTHSLEELRHEAAHLHVQSGQFLLERSSLAAYARVEEFAIEKLEMTVPNIDQVMVVKP